MPRSTKLRLIGGNLVPLNERPRIRRPKIPLTPEQEALKEKEKARVLKAKLERDAKEEAEKEWCESFKGTYTDHEDPIYNTHACRSLWRAFIKQMYQDALTPRSYYTSSAIVDCDSAIAWFLSEAEEIDVPYDDHKIDPDDPKKSVIHTKRLVVHDFKDVCALAGYHHDDVKEDFIKHYRKIRAQIDRGRDAWKKREAEKLKKDQKRRFEFNLSKDS